MKEKLKKRVDQYMEDAKTFVETPLMPLHEKEATNSSEQTPTELAKITVIEKQANLDKLTFDLVKAWHDLQSAHQNYLEKVQEQIAL